MSFVQVIFISPCEEPICPCCTDVWGDKKRGSETKDCVSLQLQSYQDIEAEETLKGLSQDSDIFPRDRATSLSSTEQIRPPTVVSPLLSAILLREIPLNQSVDTSTIL